MDELRLDRQWHLNLLNERIASDLPRSYPEGLPGGLTSGPVVTSFEVTAAPEEHTYDTLPAYVQHELETVVLEHLGIADIRAVPIQMYSFTVGIRLREATPEVYKGVLLDIQKRAFMKLENAPEEFESLIWFVLSMFYFHFGALTFELGVYHPDHCNPTTWVREWAAIPA